MQISGIIHILCRDDSGGGLDRRLFTRRRACGEFIRRVLEFPGDREKNRRGTVAGSLRKNSLFAKYAISRDVKSRHQGNWIRQLATGRAIGASYRLMRARQPRNEPAIEKNEITKIVKDCPEEEPRVAHAATRGKQLRAVFSLKNRMLLFSLSLQRYPVARSD